MEGSGRKSTASLTALPVSTMRRVEPTPGLTPAQIELWHAIVATKPGDWWGPDSAPLLAEYVRAVDIGNRLAFAIEAAMVGPVEDGASLKDLLNMRDKESRRALSLATKMRLSQQSRYTDKSAGTADRKAGNGSKPWQFQGS